MYKWLMGNDESSKSVKSPTYLTSSNEMMEKRHEKEREDLEKFLPKILEQTVNDAVHYGFDHNGNINYSTRPPRTFVNKRTMEIYHKKRIEDYDKYMNNILEQIARDAGLYGFDIYGKIKYPPSLRRNRTSPSSSPSPRRSRTSPSSSPRRRNRTSPSPKRRRRN